ncbi:MAG: DsrE/DsrF/DrsH-like family protein [Actinobacteria bacterium]|nr:DsrE/DsrF/DrsH-like family protein [Actinomycetota bacterium]
MTTENQEMVVPSFMDGDDTDRKLAIICSKGTLDMAYPGLILANGALENGIETHLFFTFWGLDMVNKKTMGKLTISSAGNTSMRFPGTSISMPQILSWIPGMTAFLSWMMRKQIRDLQVPPVQEMLQHVVDAGGHLWACKMSADMMKLEIDDLYDEVEDIINVDAFMALSEGAQVLFV